LATTRAQLGDFQSAIKDAKKGIDMNPGFKPFYQLMAQIYDKMGDKASAQQYINMMERMQ
jgi:two-component SAPR family response regulator